MITDNWHEKIHLFTCHDCRLIGIATYPQQTIHTGILIIVGGPQYRAGSHRQFTLLSRHLADSNIASFRFDYRGMGDSEGARQSFTSIKDDITAAIDCFIKNNPTITSVIIWGLCDAASAALLYANFDPRVKGLILLNPWTQMDELSAKVRFSHYYFPRLLTGAFWRKLLSREIELSTALREFLDSIKRARKFYSRGDKNSSTYNLVDNMLSELNGFKGPVLFILSGNDFTAQEFMTLTSTDQRWHDATHSDKREIKTLEEASHTFSKKEWRDTVADWTASWAIIQNEAKSKT